MNEISIEWAFLSKKEMPGSMLQRRELLEEFEAYAVSADGVGPLMQHIADRLHEAMARYNWVGFYLMEAPPFQALVLGPHAGSFNPLLRIPLDKGLCGAAATSAKTVAVNNVARDPRYLGSDLVKSNMVAPIFARKDTAGKDTVKKDAARKDTAKKRVIAELCIESYFADTFDSAEQKFIESCAELVGRYMEPESSAEGATASH
jgi:L-methionine (R)-S-oxide reductase